MAALSQALAVLGLEDPVLFAAAWDGEGATAAAWAREALPGGSADEVSALTQCLFAHAEIASRARGRLVTRLASASGLTVAVHHSKRARLVVEAAQDARRVDCLSIFAAVIAVPPLGVGLPARWPTRLRRLLGAALAATARASAEDVERRRWTAKAAEIVMEAALPLEAITCLTCDPAKTRMQVAQGRRARTIRKRVRDWLRARRFFLQAHGVPWPGHSGMVIDYIQAMSEDQGSRSASRDFLGALIFFERGGGVPSSMQLSEDCSVRAAVAEAASQISEGRMQPRKAAPRYFVAMVQALERLVCDESVPKFPRMMAWWKLAKVFGCLRFDDHRGLLPGTIYVTESGLTGSLSRTKTSGAGKSRETLPLCICTGASLSGLGWLAQGWVLWSEVDAGRDYFLPIPTADLAGVRLVEARYADGVAMSRCCLGLLKGSDGAPLLREESIGFWSEHSERATLPSWCGCLPQFPASWLDVLGVSGGRAPTCARTRSR